MSQLPLEDLDRIVESALRDAGIEPYTPPAPKPEIGALENFGNAFQRSLITQPRIAFNELTGDREEAKQLAAAADRDLPVREGFSGTLGSTIGSLLPAAGAIVATPFTGGGSLAAIPTIAAAGYQAGVAGGSALHDIHNYEDRTGDDIGDLRTAATVIGNAAVVGFTSKFGITRLGNIGAEATEQLGAAIAKRQLWKQAAARMGEQGALQSGVQQFTAKELGRAFLRTLPSTMIQGATIEAIEEAAEQAGQNAIDMTVGTRQTPSLFSGVGDAATAGGIGGLLLGPLAGGANTVSKVGNLSSQEVGRLMPDGPLRNQPYTMSEFDADRAIDLEEGQGITFEPPGVAVEGVDEQVDMLAPLTRVSNPQVPPRSKTKPKTVKPRPQKTVEQELSDLNREIGKLEIGKKGSDRRSAKLQNLYARRERVIREGQEAGYYAIDEVPAETPRFNQGVRDGVRAGDRVQWVSQGVAQFSEPRTVTDVSEDGSHVFVEGSNTGIPVSELEVEGGFAVGGGEIDVEPEREPAIDLSLDSPSLDQYENLANDDDFSDVTNTYRLKPDPIDAGSPGQATPQSDFTSSGERIRSRTYTTDTPVDEVFGGADAIDDLRAPEDQFGTDLVPERSDAIIRAQLDDLVANGTLTPQEADDLFSRRPRFFKSRGGDPIELAPDTVTPPDQQQPSRFTGASPALEVAGPKPVPPKGNRLSGSTLPPPGSPRLPQSPQPKQLESKQKQLPAVSPQGETGVPRETDNPSLSNTPQQDVPVGEIEDSPQKSQKTSRRLTKKAIREQVKKAYPELGLDKRSASDTLGMSVSERIDMRLADSDPFADTATDHDRLMARVLQMDYKGDLQAGYTGGLDQVDPADLRVGDEFTIGGSVGTVLSKGKSSALIEMQRANLGVSDVFGKGGEQFDIPFGEPIPINKGSLESPQDARIAANRERFRRELDVPEGVKAIPEDARAQAKRVIKAQSLLDRGVDAKGNELTPAQDKKLRRFVAEKTDDPQIEQAVRTLTEGQATEQDVSDEAAADAFARSEPVRAKKKNIGKTEQLKPESAIKRFLADEKGAVSIDDFLVKPVVRLVEAGKIVAKNVVDFGKALVKRFGEAIRKHIPRLWKAVKQRLAEANRRSIGAVNPDDAKRRIRQGKTPGDARKKAEQAKARKAAERPSKASEAKGDAKPVQNPKTQQKATQPKERATGGFTDKLAPVAGKVKRGLRETAGALYDAYAKPWVQRIREQDAALAERFDKVISKAKEFYGTLMEKSGGDKLRKRLGAKPWSPDGKAVTHLQSLQYSDEGGETVIQKAIADDEFLATLPQREQEIVREYREFVKSVGRVGEDAGLLQVGPDGKLRKFKIRDGRSMPRMFTGDFHNIITNGPDSPAWKALVQWLAKHNDMDVGTVDGIFKEMHDERSTLLSGGDVRRYNVEYVRAFKRFPAAIRTASDTIELLHTGLPMHANTMASRMAHRAAFVNEFGQQRNLEDEDPLVEVVKNSKADKQLVHDAFMLAHDVPIDRPVLKPGTYAYKLARGVKHGLDVMRSLYLTASGAVNVPETIFGNTQIFLGPDRARRGAMLLRSKGNEEAGLETMGAYGKAILDMSFDKSRPFASLTRMFREGTSRVFMFNQVNEYQERLAGASAHVAVNDWRAGKGVKTDVEAVKTMGFSEEQATELVNGGKDRTGDLTDLEKQFIQRAVPFLTSANAARLERSKFGNSRVFTNLFAFNSYGMMKANAFREVAGAVHRGWHDPAQRVQAAKLLGKFMLGTTAQGTATYFLMALMYGGKEGWDIAEEELADRPVTFLRDSFLFSTFAGIFGQIARFATSNQEPEEAIARLAFPTSVFLDGYDFFNGRGPYTNQDALEKANTFLTQRIPGGRLVNTAIATIGLSDKNVELEAAQRAYWRWAAETGVGKRIKDLTQEQDVLEFKKHMRRAMEAMKRGQSPSKHLNAATAFKGRKGTSASIQARRMLNRLSYEQQQDLRKRIGDSAFRRLQQWDAVLDGWAHAMR